MSTVSEDDPRLVFVPVDQATRPPSGLIEHIPNHWWVVHPQRGLVFWKLSRLDSEHPQCNSQEAVTRRFIGMYPWAEVRLIPSVFRRIHPQDYA